MRKKKANKEFRGSKRLLIVYFWHEGNLFITGLKTLFHIQGG